MKLLISMNEVEYDTYIKDKTERYALTLEENTFEMISETAFVRAEKAIKGYLPNGFNTENHEFYNILENEKVVGYVWIKIVKENKSAFLYEIYLKEEFRSKGIGKKVMTELESLLAVRKIAFFKLHVFGNNEHALNLYNNLGFQVAGINMYKEIDK
ncbi:GNAT family N-acetyltransferase [Solibacillus isronensis]|uniref:GNAT family N-acetyltransferase n=1 Tax=Solibacillus isronensis TaxID=412383 RepID=UPI002041E64F|nr:GNAT family N-acetyltransferase [Solibacillus isronensis]